MKVTKSKIKPWEQKVEKGQNLKEETGIGALQCLLVISTIFFLIISSSQPFYQKIPCDFIYLFRALLWEIKGLRLEFSGLQHST